jgi:hypothetical protein
MGKFAWICLTVIAILIVLGTKDTLCYYWDCRYGLKKKEPGKIDEKPYKRKVVTGFSRNKSIKKENGND